MRTALYCVFSLIVVATGLAAEPAAPWYRRLIVGTEVGPTGAQSGIDPSDVGYAAKFNGRDIVAGQLAANSQYVVVWGKDSEFAYYDSKVAPKCPGLGGRDVLRETVDAAKPHNLPVIVYCVVQGNGYPLRQHPEFKMVDAAGKPIDRICLNSGYLAHAKAVVDEMLAYGIDGFHIDMLDQGFGPPYGCWCAACREKFQARYAKPMPKGVTWDADWDRMMEFRFAASADFERAMRAHIRKAAPRVTVDFNYHGYPPFSWEVGQRPVQHAVEGDFVTAETGIWGFSALGVGETARVLAATNPGAPFQVAMSRHAKIYHDNTVRPVADLKWEMFTLLAHGAQVTVVDKTGYDGKLDMESFRRLGVAFAEARAKQPHFGQPIHADVGLYYSHRSRDWYGRETPAKYQQAFHGAHKALTYEHIPYDVLLDENADEAKLARHPVVLLPHATVLSAAELAKFRRYVEAGGTLLLTGHSGLFDRYGRPLSAVSASASLATFESLVGAKLVQKMPDLDNHVRFANLPAQYKELARGIPDGWAHLVMGPAAIWRPTTAAAVGELWKPHRTLRQTKGQEGTTFPNSPDAPVGPAILVNRLGKGRVVCFACGPDYALGGEWPLPESRFLLRNAVRWAHPQPAVAIQAPLCVETIVTDDAARRTLRVHMIGYATPPQTTPAVNRPYVLPQLIEEAPLYKATVTLSRPIKQARALGKDTQVAVDRSRIQVTAQEIHEVLVVEY